MPTETIKIGQNQEEVFTWTTLLEVASTLGEDFPLEESITTLVGIDAFAKK